MHASGNGDEDAVTAGQGRMITKDVLEYARSRSAGVLGLGDLSQLEGVAEQDQISRGVR
jgi:hypothetical protein